MLAFTFEKSVEKLMRTRGLPGTVLQGNRLSFDIEEAVVAFKPNLGDLIKSRLINQESQLRTIDRLIATPLRGQPVVCINSYPTDLRATCVAANIMEAAFFKYFEGQKSRRPVGQPLWVRLYSDKWAGYINDIREKKPSLLIISNITSSSSQQRLEKLRDCLDYFDSIPRIVVTGTTSTENPIEFFANRLHFPLTKVVQIGPANKIQSLLDI